MPKKLIVLFIFGFTCHTLFAQAASDTSYLPEPFYATFEDGLPVYSGRLFPGYASQIKGSPYLPTESWASGTVQYNNIPYNIVSLKYNTYTDELVIQTPSRFSIIPVNYRISAFSLGEKKFIRIDSLRKSTEENGFYELIAEGALSLLAKRRTTLEQKIEQMVLEYEFVTADEFYIYYNNQIKKISSKGDLFAIVKDKKKIIKRALKPLRLNFRKNRETLIITAIETYNKN